MASRSLVDSIKEEIISYRAQGANDDRIRYWLVNEFAFTEGYPAPHCMGGCSAEAVNQAFKELDSPADAKAANGGSSAMPTIAVILGAGALGYLLFFRK